MKKIFNLVLLFVFSLSLISCGSKNNEIKNFQGKIYQGYKSHQILILEKKLFFSKDSGINYFNIKTKDDIEKLGKEGTKEYNNPKILEKDGKKYLTADDFEFKILLKDDKTFLDEENNYEYILVKDLNKK